MANSKSNIYPIQLQGAELNLNKFDAEIKQYSGFNRNNAPFVGGCLSNLFTKNETITGTTSKNLFVAPNGDIYEAKADGLYKNDVILFRYENDKFYKVEEIPVEENVVRVFGEKLKLCRTYGTWTYSETSFTETYTGVKITLKIDDEELSDDNVLLFFSTNEVWDEEQIENAIKNNVTCIYVTDNNKQYAILLSSFRIKRNTMSSSDEYSQCAYIVIDLDEMQVTDRKKWNIGNNVYYETSVPVAICFVPYGGVNHISFYASSIVKTNMNSQIWARFGTFTDGVITLHNQNITSITTRSGQSNRKNIATSISWYTVLSYPLNTILIKNLPVANVTDDNVFRPIFTMQNPIRDNNNISLEANSTGFQIRKIYGSTEKDTDQGMNLRDGVITSLFASYDYQMASSEDGTTVGSICYHMPDSRREGFSFDNHYTLNTTPELFSKGKYNLGSFLNIGNFKILFNNNQFSGIAGKYVLLTNWNTVEPYSVTYFLDARTNTEKIYYKEGDKWFVIKADTPKIKLVNNQLVLNLDSNKNSFDIKRNKILFYAPNFNGVNFLGDSYPAYDLYAWQGVTNNLLIAGAVNEYKQEDNSSIILNPIGIHCSSKTNAFNQYLVFTVFEYPVNIYMNYKSDNVIDYAYTYVGEPTRPTDYRLKGRGSSIKNELVGLPFPSDTNGNVEYSPSLFAVVKNVYGNQAFIKNGNTFYPLVIGNNSLPIMSFYMASGIDNFEDGFIIQGQFYGIMNNSIYSVAYVNGVVGGISFVVNIEGLQFCGNTPYEALFYSKTNRCLYSFTGANILNSKQFVDKISSIKNYMYNPSTQSIFLLTDIGVIVYSLFGIYQIDMPEAEDMFIIDNGAVLTDNLGNYRYIRYYKEDTEDDFLKENIKLETCFYGMNNQTVTINDCLYMRIFSEEHDEGDLEVSATTLSLKGRVTEKTTFKIKADDWDKETHTIYLRYQPKEQRGLGISFKVESPFKIASLSVGSKADAILVDKVSKGAINAPYVTSNNDEW